MQAHKPTHIKKMESAEADFLMNLYNYPVVGVKEFFEVDLQGEIWVEDELLKFDDYQIGAFLDWRSKRQLDYCGRGVGKSQFMAALKWAYWGVVLPYVMKAVYGLKRPMAIRFVLTANNLETAKQLLQYTRNWLTIHPLFADEIDSQNDSKMSLRLKNGTEFHVRASSDSARGLNPYSYHSDRLGRTVPGMTVIISDEFAYVVDQSFFKEAVEPYLAAIGFSVFHALTTPNGKENMAYDCSMDKDFKVRTTESHLNIYRDPRELAKIRRRLVDAGFPEVWNEEYLGIPQDQRWRFFPEKLILKCIEMFPGGVLDQDVLLWSDAYIEEHASELVNKCGDLYLGGDPNKGKMERGNLSDACAISIVEVRKNPTKVITRYAMEWGNSESSREECRKAIGLNEYIDKLEWLFRVLKIKKGLLDINPGVGIVNGLQRRHPWMNIDCIDTDSPKLSRDVDSLALTMMESGERAIPPHIDLQRAYKRYGRAEKRTGKKKTDLVKADLYSIWCAMDGKVSSWSPGQTVKAEKREMNNDYRRKSILQKGNLTSVGISSRTSIRSRNGQVIH